MEILTTYNYEIFKVLKGNRPVSESNIKLLIASFKEKHLRIAIYVNEFLEVIDGQHRKLVCEMLGLPVDYIIKDGWGINEARMLNAKNRTWKPSDYENMYCTEGMQSYLDYRSFKNTYKLNHSSCVAILKSETLSHKEHSESFKNGKLIISDLEHSHKIAQHIMTFKKYNLKVSKKTGFHYALLRQMRKDGYSIKHMEKQLVKYGGSSLSGSRAGEADLSIIALYNYGSRNTI